MSKKSQNENLEKNQEIKLPENLVKTNHEFLFIYDAKLCNPNGDPDNENKPRMDEEREINLVSDLRLKRYIRDYLKKYKLKDIYVSKLKDNPVKPEEILNDLIERKDKLEFKDDKIKREFYLKNLIDVRMFGATMAIEGNTQTFTGPIQINWGYSLNNVSLCESNTITTHFKSSDKATQGSIGKDYRVNYSLIAFYGNIIAKKAEHTLLTEDDIKLFDESIIQSIPLLATRSKIGQYPRFYIRFEYNSSEYLYGDIRKLINLELNDLALKKDNNLKLDNIRDISEIQLDVSKLEDLIKDFNKSNIEKKETKLIKSIKFWKSEDLMLKGEINV